MSETRAILEGYLRHIGLSRRSDAAQQLQITLLRQWTDHLDQVLMDEEIPARQHTRIIRAMIYGAIPALAEAEIREMLLLPLIDPGTGRPLPGTTGGNAALTLPQEGQDP